jgi:hypothetical protein
MSSPRANHARYRFFVGVCLAFSLLTLVIGCGPDYKARAVVKGKVTMAKKPLTSGTVMFYGPNNITSSAIIDENGDYAMNDAPIGDVTITVVVNAPPGMGAGPKGVAAEWKKVAGVGESKDPTGENPGIAIMSKLPTNVVRIDAKYGKPESSGLKYKVEKGEHTHNIEL